jgi:hypothetical protein
MIGAEAVGLQQYSRGGTDPWTTFCTLTTTPYSCRFDTTTLPGGSYSFRATATDAGGLSTTSAAIANRVIDNTITSVSLEDPGEYLTGTVALTAAANSTAACLRPDPIRSDGNHHLDHGLHRHQQSAIRRNGCFPRWSAPPMTDRS